MVQMRQIKKSNDSNYMNLYEINNSSSATMRLASIGAGRNNLDLDGSDRHIRRLESIEANVIATARGVFGSEGGSLISAETNVSIIIPPNAIPEGTMQEIYFKVCEDKKLAPPLDREKGKRLSQ